MTFQDFAKKGIPEDLTGWTVLDVGGYDGWATKVCMERGAQCTIVDNRQYREYGWADPPEIPGVRYVEQDFLRWSYPADLVLCGNTIYHIENPPMGIVKLRELTQQQLILWTSYVTEGSDGDDWRWYPDGKGHPKGTVWARPTIPGLMRTLYQAGFIHLNELGRESDYVVVDAR